MNKFNQAPSGGRSNGPTGWESVESMAGNYPQSKDYIDPAKFEKPSENLNTINSAVKAYLRCDPDKQNSYYNEVMTSGTERWYPQIKAYQTPAKDKFDKRCFEEWKQNIIAMDAQTAFNKYGRGKAFDALKKIHNFLKSGGKATNQTELLNKCFSQDDDGFDAAHDYLKYDKRSDAGWWYYSSKDEKLGMEDHARANGRLYLNAEPMDTFEIANQFVDACKEAGLPYEFKINKHQNRSDAMVFYINNNNITDYVSILSKVLEDDPGIGKRIGPPPMLTEKITGKIGYGDETGGMSYNDRQCANFQHTIESVVNAFRGPAPQGSTHSRAKYLYSTRPDQFINVIKDNL